jgi:DNA-binding response OmpR family regulator
VEPSRPAVQPHVLVGDDDQDVVRIVDAHLAAVGYRRTLAYDGVQTIEEARAQRPDLVILDLMMPKLTGFDVLAVLKDMGSHRPKVLVLSARGRQEDVVRAFQLGADDFLVKPFKPQELLGRVARLVESLQERRTA